MNKDLSTDDLLGVLGLPSEGKAPTLGDVKRAYFARLREHPPHSDPTGFQRLREAYERLLAPGVLTALAASSGQSRQALLDALDQRLEPRLVPHRASQSREGELATRRETFERVVAATSWGALLEAFRKD
jgi:hypothetical protein